MEKVTVGLKETKEVIDFAIALGTGVEASLEDKKITFTDLPNFFPALFKIKDAIEDIDQVPLEFKLATTEELEELKQYLRDTLDLKDDQMEEFIEDAFGVILDIWHLSKKYFIESETPSTGDISEDTAPAVE